MSEFTIGRRGGILTRQRLVKAGSNRHRLDGPALRRMVFDSGFWHRVGTASGRCRGNPGLCHQSAVDLT